MVLPSPFTEIKHYCLNFTAFCFRIIGISITMLLFITPINTVDVMDRFTWYNEHIKAFNTKMWLNANAIESAILCLKDIYNATTNAFFSFEEITNRYGTCTDLSEYHKLIRSIPPIWKIMLKQRVVGEKRPNGIEQAKIASRFSTHVYWKVLPYQNRKKEKSVPQESAIKLLWEHDLKIEIPDKEWENIQENTFPMVKSIKLRYFQYKHVQRRLQTNIQLSKYKPEKTDVPFVMSLEKLRSICYGLAPRSQ